MQLAAWPYGRPDPAQLQAWPIAARVIPLPARILDQLQLAAWPRARPDPDLLQASPISARVILKLARILDLLLPVK